MNELRKNAIINIIKIQQNRLDLTAIASVLSFLANGKCRSTTCVAHPFLNTRATKSVCLHMNSLAVVIVWLHWPLHGATVYM